jgi:hypothetical protein
MVFVQFPPLAKRSRSKASQAKTLARAEHGNVRSNPLRAGYDLSLSRVATYGGCSAAVNPSWTPFSPSS